MALQSNNGANYARFGTNARVCTGRSFTLECWVNASALPATYNVIAAGQTSAGDGWEVGHATDGGVATVYLGYNQGGSYYGYGISFGGDTVNVPLPTGRWVHLAWWFFAERPSYLFAVDGRIVPESISPVLGAALSAQSTAALGLKQSYDNSGLCFTGALARLRMYDGIVPAKLIRRSAGSPDLLPELESQCIANVPLRREPTLVVRDDSPAALGVATQTGTVTQAVDPDTAPSLRRLRAVRAPSGTSANVFFVPTSMPMFVPRIDPSGGAALAMAPAPSAAHTPTPALSAGAALDLTPHSLAAHTPVPALSGGAALAIVPAPSAAHTPAPALSAGAAVALTAAALASHSLPPSLFAGASIVFTSTAVALVTPQLTASAGASVELALAVAPLALHIPTLALSAGAALALMPAQAGLYAPLPSLAAGAVLGLAPVALAAHSAALALSAGAALTLTPSSMAMLALPVVGVGGAVVDVSVAAPTMPLALHIPAPALSADAALALAPTGLAAHTTPLSLAGAAAVVFSPAALNIVARALGLSGDALLSLPPGSLVLVAPAWVMTGGVPVAARLVWLLRADRRVYAVPVIAARRVAVPANHRIYRVPSDQEVLVSTQQIPVFELPSIRNGEKLDFDFDFTDWLSDAERVTGDTLASATPAVWDLHGLTKDSQSQTTTVARVWIAPTGIVAGRSYPIDCTVTTTQGRVVTRTAILRVVAMQ